MTPEQNDIFIKMFVSVGANTNSKGSLTAILGELNYMADKLGVLVRDLTIEDVDDLQIRCISARTNFAEKIGVRVPAEKKYVMDVLGRVDLEIFTGANDPIALINEKLEEQKLTFRVSPNLLPYLKSIVEKSHVLYRGLNNLKLFSVIGKTLDVAQYYKKYLVMPQEEVQKRITYLRDTYMKILDNCLEPGTMVNIAVDALSRFNHLQFTLVDKDPEELLAIIYYEQIAAEGTLNALARKQGQAISENDVKDGIARILATKKYAYLREVKPEPAKVAPEVTTEEA